MAELAPIATGYVKEFVQLAEQVMQEVARDPVAQEWRRDRIAIQVGRALAALGDREGAAKAVAGVEANTLHAVDADVAAATAAVTAAGNVNRSDMEVSFVIDAVVTATGTPSAPTPRYKVAVTVARPNLPYSTASTQAGIQRLRMKALCVSVWFLAARCIDASSSQMSEM